MADLDAQGFEKGSAQMTIEITEDELKITLGKKRAVIPVARSPEGEYGPDLLVFSMICLSGWNQRIWRSALKIWQNWPK